jgi:hypothetical protein
LGLTVTGQPYFFDGTILELCLWQFQNGKKRRLVKSLFFTKLDEVIEKQKATLAAWEALKKGLLQQMFV